MHPLQHTAIKAARQAGKQMLRYLDRLDSLDVTTKGRRDFVTEVDRIAEEEIIEVIRRAHPDHAILAEETGARGDADWQWIIDPLDGTTNYLHGHPQFAVSIAARRRQRLEIGVIFDPLRNEMFVASAGEGARLNDRRIRVSRTTRLEHALLGTGFPPKEIEHIEFWLDTLRIVYRVASGVRRAGSAALDLAWVACGRLDGFWELGLSPWDMAAGALLVREAGGLTTDFDNGGDFLEAGCIISANPHLHPELLRIVRHARSRHPLPGAGTPAAG